MSPPSRHVSVLDSWGSLQGHREPSSGMFLEPLLLFAILVYIGHLLTSQERKYKWRNVPYIKWQGRDARALETQLSMGRALQARGP